MYCSNCGARLDSDSAFCPACGTPCAPAQRPEPLSQATTTAEKPAQEPLSQKPSSAPPPKAANSYYAVDGRRPVRMAEGLGQFLLVL